MVFPSSFTIGPCHIGERHPPFIIAEAGLSHFGDMDLAHQLVDLAAKAGADAFKTQFFDVDVLIAKRASEWRDRLRPRNLTFKQAREIKDLCDQRGLLFMSTAHDESRIPWLVELDVPAVKVGSGERNNPAFLKKLAALGKPMIVSTGMYSEPDVEEAIGACAAGGCRQLALLHCVTSYPTPAAQVNLAAMDRLKTMFPGPVGYSDHTVDGMAVLAAAARGAAIIEKHITILRDVPNAHDWKVSAGPETFPQLVAEIRRMSAMIGHGRKEAAPCESDGAKWALKSLVAIQDLPAGHRLTEEDLTAKRPGGSIPPNRLHDVIGRRLTRGLKADEALSWDNIEAEP
ncbi:MAG TPA: N-acetylneuraminate synthase family protein [Nitrospiraceae bacterium]|nr:N-acetylneuraminate synthase family protein [Nitrospiraceae bacterium]